MNFGKKGLEDKIKRIRSRKPRLINKVGTGTLRGVVVLFIIAIIVASSLIAGMYDGIVAGTPSVEDVNIMPAGQATFIYDQDGNMLQQLNSADGNRISVSIDSIPEDMQHAIVAIEDSRFYEHNGIDPIGMVRALAVAISTGFARTEGASTITQQLLKNNVFTEWTSETRFERIVRKIQEQQLAVELESTLDAQGEDTKSVILENYLNTVNFGAGTYGVETAARTYFGKSCSELTLSECAVLAAIPQNPTRYNPITHPDLNRARQETVLLYMLEQGYITEEEYVEALNDDVYSRIQDQNEEAEAEEEPYSYFVDVLITQLLEDLEELGYTEVQAQNLLYSGGLRIYTTMDSEIQEIMEEEFENEENFPDTVSYSLDWALTLDKADGERVNYSREMLQVYFRENLDSSFDLIFDSEEEAQYYVDLYKEAVIEEGDEIVAERISFTEEPQAAMVVIDQETGYVKGVVGGRGEKTASLVLNRATDSYRQPGSTFKIISTYGPALEMGEITLATIVTDEEYSYSDGTPLRNADGAYHGDVTIREAITYSYNVVAVKVLTEITPQTGFDYLLELGFTQLINDEAYDVVQPLALGGITNGVSMLELAAAYATIANEGVYNEPIFYTLVTDQDGNVILENEAETRQVFSESTSYLLTSAMEDVVDRGTGISFAIDGMTLAGKTGTTTLYRDLVFAGFTPYYTAAIWAGYDVSAELDTDQRTYYQVLWRNVMTRIHEGLEDKEFEMPSSVEKLTICSESGLLAGVGCNTTTEYFAKSNRPTTRCTSHIPILTVEPDDTDDTDDTDGTDSTDDLDEDETSEPEATEPSTSTSTEVPDEDSGEEAKG